MYTGLTGKITIGGNKVAYISNWSIEDSTDIIETTTLGESHKEKIPGLQGWSASADGAVDFTFDYGETTPDKSSQMSLIEAKNSGDLVECKFYLNDDTYYTGSGYIESLSIDLSSEDKGNISISISGSGELELYVNGTKQ